MNLVESLQNLGFAEKEAKIYLALLQQGPTTAYVAALRSNLKKPTAYVVLENLVNKGIVKKLPRARKALYAAISPEDLFSIAKSKIKDAEEVLPELKSLSSRKEGEYKIKTFYYEGLNSIKELYMKLLKTMKGEEYVGFFAHDEDAPPELLKYFDEVNELYRKFRVRRRGITVHAPTIADKYLNEEFVKKFGVKLKALPKEKYNSNISIEVYKNYTQIFSHRYLQATVIDNPDVANVIRQIFELVWERDDVIGV